MSNSVDQKTAETPAMKSKDEIAKDYFNEIESLGFPHDQNMVSMFIDGMTEQEIISKQQTAELQQEVERLKSERDGERLQVERLMIENGVMFKALQKIESLYWEQESLGDIYIVATEALNTQHDENRQ